MSKIDWKKLEGEVRKLYEKLAPTSLKAKLTYLGTKDYAAQTKIFSRGIQMTPGQKHDPFDAEATVYVWHEKNVLKLPKWLVGTKFNTGHAALRIANFDATTQKHDVVRYLSWWPEGGANKKDGPQPGGLSKNIGNDRLLEMTSDDEELLMVLKLLLVRQALEKTANGRQEFEDFCFHYWAGLDKDVRKRLKDDYKVGEFFMNLSHTTVKAQANQKLLDGIKIYTGKNHFGKNIIPTANISDTLSKDFDQLMVVKQPYSKVYVPCSSPPVPVYDKDRYQRSTVWGLSIHAMELAARFYETPGTLYKMKGFNDNCIGAVWTVLKAGLADVISDRFKTTKGPVNNFTHLVSLVPSDAINASVAVMEDILERTQQQFFLDVQAQNHRQALIKIAENENCFGRDWRIYVLNSVWWRDFSDDQGMRPDKKRKIDDLVLKFSKLANNTAGKDDVEIAALLKLEAQWDKGKNDREGLEAIIGRISQLSNEIGQKNDEIGKIKQAIPDLRQGKTVQALPNLTLYPDDLSDLPKEIKNLEDQAKNKTIELEGLKKAQSLLQSKVDSNVKLWEESLKTYENDLRAKAETLVDLHDAIFDYIYSCGPYGMTNPSKRYLTCLLLGQFVAWMYAELANPNLAVGFHGLNEMGLIIANFEKDKRLHLKNLHHNLKPTIGKQERLLSKLKKPSPPFPPKQKKPLF